VHILADAGILPRVFICSERASVLHGKLPQQKEVGFCADGSIHSNNACVRGSLQHPR
jgi:hypothetical protein